MTGRGHRLTGLGAGLFAAGIARVAGWDVQSELIAGVVAACSTTLPDWLEIPRHRKGQRIGSLVRHRTITHWGLLWVALLVWGVSMSTFGGAMLMGASVGALFHLMGDAPNPMGVPWLWPTRRLRIGKKGLWRSGQFELPLIVFFTALGAGVWYLSGLAQESEYLSMMFLY